jgi:hypothetical protein
MRNSSAERPHTRVLHILQLLAVGNAVIMLGTCSAVSDFASSSTLTSGLAAVSPGCQGCRSHPSVFAPDTMSVMALSKCWPCAGWHGTVAKRASHPCQIRGSDRAVAHRVVLHVIKAALPVQLDCNRGAHWQRRHCCVHDSTVGVPLHILYAGCGAIFRHQHATVGRLATAYTT